MHNKKSRSSFVFTDLLRAPSDDRPAVAKFSKSSILDKIPEVSILILELPKYSYSLHAKNQLSTFNLVEHRLVTGHRQTDTQTQGHSIRGLSRLTDQGDGRNVRGGSRRPNPFCECTIVGLRTTLCLNKNAHLFRMTVVSTNVDQFLLAAS